MAESPPRPVGSPAIFAAGLSVVMPGWHDPDFIGPLLFGTMLQVGFFCILVVQCVVFFAQQGHGLNDNRLFKLYIGSILLFTTLQVTHGIWKIYNICVLLHPWALLPFGWLELVLNCIVVESVHAFFIFRCYKLSQSKLVLGIILTMLFVQSVAGIGVAISAAKAVNFHQLWIATITICSTSLILDTMISVTLFFNLWRQRTGQGEIDIIVLCILRTTVESIVPCLICLIILLVSVANLGTAPLGGLFPLALSPVTPLYANALLVTLNARLGFRRQLENSRDRVISTRVDNIQFRNFNQDQRTTDASSCQSTNQVQRGSMSYDISFARATELSSDGRHELGRTASKSRSLCPDVDVKSDICSEEPAMLSPRRIRSHSAPQHQV